MKADERSAQHPAGAPARRLHEGRIEARWPRPRDLEVLRWAGEQYAARLEHVEAVAGCSRPVARQIAQRLRDAGLVRTRRYVVGEPMWLMPTWRGLRASDMEGNGWVPSVGRLAHMAAVNDVRLYIHEQRPQMEWISERRLRSEHPNSRKDGVHLPDGVAIIEGHPVAVEVELHYKGPRSTQAIVYELSQRYDAVFYYCDRLPHGKLLRLEKTGRWPKLAVRTLPGADWAEPQGG